MKTLMLALVLLVSLPVVSQQEPTVKHDTAAQQTGKASGGKILVQDEGPPNQHTESAERHKNAPVKAPMPQQGCAERLWIWLKSLSNSDLLLVVTALYLLATYGIFRQMVRQNENAEVAYKNSARDTQESLELTRDAVTAIAGAARAWITIHKIKTTTMRDGIPDWVRVTFKNTGHSPAINAALTGHCIIDAHDIIPGTPGPEEKQTPLASNVTFGAGGTFSLDVSPQIFSSDEMREKVAGGTRTLFVAGGVRYDDVFNRERRHILQYAAKYDVGFKHWVIYINHSD